MTSLVSDFIIFPVLRQARRFSSGFASGERAISPVRQSKPSGSKPEALDGIENAILEEAADATVLDGQQACSGMNAGINESIHPHPSSSRTQTHSSMPVRTASGAHDAPEPAAPTGTIESRPDVEARRRAEVDEDGAMATWFERDQPSTALPEDDGMLPLRRRIQAIQSQEVSQGLKARLMHQLLLEGYTKSQLATQTKIVTRTEIPAYISALPEPHEQAGPLQAIMKWNPLGDGVEALDLPLTEDDLRPTHVPAPIASDDVTERFAMMEFEEQLPRPLGCEHYQRNVKLQCAQCQRWYTCRFCHDAAEDHTLPRKETKHMLCMLCGCAQTASDTCTRCGQYASQYYCGICKLWNDDANKSIYHCFDCGLCRVGQGLGKDFFHCKKCTACVSVKGSHKCIERSIDCNCPICGDYMFNSPRTVIFMQCGHAIHRVCFEQHMQTSYRCPICSKSCVNMEYQFRQFDLAIASQPMPAAYRDARAIIFCNDCNAKSQAVYHWLGLRCAICNSYNTVQKQLLDMPTEQAVRAFGEQQPVPEDRQADRLGSLEELMRSGMTVQPRQRSEHFSPAPGLRSSIPSLPPLPDPGPAQETSNNPTREDIVLEDNLDLIGQDERGTITSGNDGEEVGRAE